jgi:hypothetical protein
VVIGHRYDAFRPLQTLRHDVGENTPVAENVSFPISRVSLPGVLTPAATRMHRPLGFILPVFIASRAGF